MIDTTYIARSFTQIGHSDELGTGVRNVFKFSEPFFNSKKIVFNDNDVFITEVPLKMLFNSNDTVNDTVNDRQNNIINAIKINKTVTIDHLSEKCNVTRLTVIRDLKKLKEQNIIKRIGPNKGGYWEVIK